MNRSTAADLFKRNTQLLVSWLRGETDDLAKEFASDSQTTGKFLKFVSQQGLGFQFAVALEDSPLRSHIDQATLAERERSREIRRERQAKLITQLKEIDDLLRSRNLDYRLLKGPFLAERFYGGSDNRQFGDLDILIHSERLPEADELLASCGFQRRTSAPLSDRLATRFAHGFDYQRGPYRIDLHWAPATHPSYRIHQARLWESAPPLVIADRNIPVLSDESALLFLAVSFFEDIERGAGKLKSAIDIERMASVMEGQTNWQALLQRAEAEGFGRIFPAILRLTSDLASSRERMPMLAAELDKIPTRAPATWKDRSALLEAPRGSLRNKLWAWRLYDYPRPLAIAWWALSLPARRAIYAPVRFFGSRPRPGPPAPGERRSK